ncbi:MAG: hypothetical protein EKK29_08070 [Hyphomicrobiales bacterium]|nr:MAG: hypothetical protein EKK29_08070 [Hyphomicrobiales bacterium]
MRAGNLSLTAPDYDAEIAARVHVHASDIEASRFRRPQRARDIALLELRWLSVCRHSCTDD